MLFTSVVYRFRSRRLEVIKMPSLKDEYIDMMNARAETLRPHEENCECPACYKLYKRSE